MLHFGGSILESYDLLNPKFAPFSPSIFDESQSRPPLLMQIIWQVMLSGRIRQEIPCLSVWDKSQKSFSKEDPFQHTILKLVWKFPLPPNCVLFGSIWMYQFFRKPFEGSYRYYGLLCSDNLRLICVVCALLQFFGSHFKTTRLKGWHLGEMKAFQGRLSL